MDTLNKLTVPTFRWLKVNEYNIKDYKLPILKQYRLDYFQVQPFISQTTKSSREILPYGVSAELVQLSEENYNAGVEIKVPDNTRVEQPIVLNFKVDKANNVLVDNNTIYVGENSEVTIIFDYYSDNDIEGFHNGITKVYAAEASKVKIIKLQRLGNNIKNFDSNVASVKRNANIHWLTAELGSDISVANFTTYLQEDLSEGTLESIYLVDKKRELDVSYSMIHEGRRTTSKIKGNGVVDDFGKKIFKGTLDFKRGAAKSKGSEEEYVLLLNEKAKADSIPTLLCEEEDVEGQHAASVGQIDESKLFYIMSRGLSEDESKKTIIEGSFRPVLDAIEIQEIREKIEDEIHRRIRK